MSVQGSNLKIFFQVNADKCLCLSQRFEIYQLLKNENPAARQSGICRRDAALSGYGIPVPDMQPGAEGSVIKAKAQGPLPTE